MRSGASSFLISNSRDVIDDISTTVGERLELCSRELKNMYETEFRDETRIAAMDEKLDAMMTMLAILEHNENGRNRNQQNRLESSQTQFQVSSLNLEQPEEQSLGYRSGVVDIENSKSAVPKIETPMFYGTHPYVWIEEVEKFFQLGKHGDEAKLDLVFLCFEGAVYKWFSLEMRQRRFSDWADFKKRLVAEFGHNQNCYPSESRLRKDSIPKEPTPTMVTVADSTSDTESILELGNKKTEIIPELVRPQFTELPHSREAGSCCDSLPEVLPKHESLHEIIKKQASLTQSSSILQLQQIEQSVIEDSFDAYRFGGKETVQVVKQLESSNVNNISVNIDEKRSFVQQPCSFTNLVSSKERDPMLYEIMRMMEDAESVKGSQVLTGLLRHYSVHQQYTSTDQRVINKHKQRKFYKTWKFRYKTRFLQQLRTHGVQLKIRDQLILRYFSVYIISPRSWAVIKRWYQGNMSYCSNGMKQLVHGDTTSHVWHKWRSKTVNLLNIAEQMTSRVDQAHLLLLQKRSKMNWPLFCPSETLDQSQVLSLYAILIFQLFFAIKVEGERTELLPYGSSHESFPIIISSPSLRSSLFSREGVYKRTLIYWFRVNVLIWLFLTSRETDLLKKDVKKQREKTEQKTHWMVQMLNKERGSLLLYSKRDLLQVLIQQKRKWKIWYKSLMFKYKQRGLEHLIKEVFNKCQCHCYCSTKS